MAGKDLFSSVADDRKRLRHGTNRQLELAMQSELHDVAQKSLSEISAKKESRRNAILTDDQKLCLKMRPELKLEKKRPERKSQPVYHDDLKPRDISKEQMLLLPHVPPTNPPDEAAKVIMQSRTRKFPYSKGELVTTEDMKKPKTSSVGVIPIRSSCEVDSMKVIIKASSKSHDATLDEIEVASRAQENVVPRLQLDDIMGGDGMQREASMPAPEETPFPDEKLKKPAILASLGTIGGVTLTQRAKPAPKPAVMHTTRRGLSSMLDVPREQSRAKSGRSVQSSLLSEDLMLPDEAVYSKYDDAIAMMDVEVDTAVATESAGAGKLTDSPGVKSVKQLLEEAKRISGAGAQPLYQAHLKPSSKSARSSAGTKGPSSADGHKSARKKGRPERGKSGTKGSAGKTSARDADATAAADQAPKDRSVDEIVAALKQQAGSGIMTEADRKIQEIMERVMFRTATSDGDDSGSVGTPEVPPVNDTGEGYLADGDDRRSSPTSPTGDDRLSGVLSPSDHLDESQREVQIPTLIPEEAEPGDVDALSTRTGKTGDTLAATTDISIDQTEDQVPPPVEEDTAGVMKQDEDEDVEMEDHLNIQQAWQDLMAPAEATYEELVSVVGESLDFHTRGIPGPVTGDRPMVNSTSVSFLSTWAPTGLGYEGKSESSTKAPEPPTRNIHHFCKMTSEFQLPHEFRHIGRKYHAPDLYRGVFPDQPYRFEEETLQSLEDAAEAVKSATSSLTARDPVAAAAQRIVDEANKSVSGDNTLEEWKAKAEKALSQEEISVDGQRLVPGTDESRVYWAPAPPKMEVAPAKVRQLLFPQYQSGEVDEFGRLVLHAPVEPESESEEEEEEESPEEIENRELVQRLLGRQHQSCEDLTQLMKMEIRREELIRDKVLDVHTYRLLITPPPTPVEEPDPKAAKDMPRGITIRSPSREKTAQPPPSPVTEAEETKKEKILGPYDDTLFAPVYFPPPRRTRSLPRLLADLDDTLMVPLDFNAAMEEIREQRQLIEKAKRQRRLQDAEDELATMEDSYRQPQQQPVEDRMTHVDILRISHTPKKEDELTPAEKALLAGRSYVILPKKKKKKVARRPLDMARLESIQKFLSLPPKKIARHSSLHNIKRAVERELRVPQRVRHRKDSLPDLLNFEQYKKTKRMPKSTDEREWVRDIWNQWFDEVFPPTPVDSEDDFEDDATQTDAHTAISSDMPSKDDKKKTSKTSVPEILSEEIDVIDPVADTEENADIISILREEVEKLTQLIDSMTPPMAFDLARRGALYRKLGLLHKAGEDLNRAIKMEPMLLDAYWHRHLLYVLQDKKAEALEDLNYIMKHNKNHAGAYRSMAEIYRKQGDITMAIVNYTQAIKMNPTDHDAYFQRAEMYEQRGEKLLALEDYSNCMKLMPTRTDAIIKHGLYYFQNENWTSCINDFTELLRVDPLNAVGRLYRGRAYAKMSQWSPAVEDLSASIHLDPMNWESFYHRACVLRKAHPKRALQDYSVSLLINDSEDNIMSYLHRGILYNAQGRPEDAIPDFEAVLKLNKDIACAHVNLGLIFMTKHLNHHRAIKKFTSAIKVDPTYVRAYVCRGEAYHKIHELKLALKDFTRAIHLRPDIHHYYMFRGQLVLELGNLELAAFCVRHASEMGGQGNSSAFGDRPTQQAAVQSFLKNYDKAIDALMSATRVKPVMPLFMLLGKTQMKAKQFKEAAASFERALDLMEQEKLERTVMQSHRRPWRQRDPWPAEAAEAHFLSGMCHMEMRSYLPSLNAFNNAINQDSNYAEAYYQRGLARMKLKQSKGVQDFNRALAINPNIFQAYLSRACYYGLKGVYTKAILNCNEAIKLQPNSVRAYLYRGALKYHIKAFDLAIRDLTKAASIDNTCPLPYFNRAVCFQENKQYSKALTDYGIVLLLGEQLGLKVLINRGLLYFEQADYINALYDFQNASKLSPVDHRIHHTLGLCFHKLGRLQEAVSTFTKCLQLKPFFLDGLIARGNVFMDYGHEAGIKQARRDYERALRLDPMCLAARVNLAYTLQVCGKLMRAWRNFTIAITLKGSFKPALEGRAIVNLQMSNTFGAFQDISSSIHQAATAELLTNRGVINQFMNDRVNAMRDYQRAIKLDPKYSLAYFNAANVYFHTRHFNQALDYYNKAVEHNPKDESALLNRAITKVLLRDSKSALEDFKAAIKLSPHSAHIYFNRANLYTAMGQHEKAEKDYSKALTLQPDDPLTLKRRADVRGKLGRQEEAIEDYRRAVDIQTRPHVVGPHPPPHPPSQSAKPRAVAV